MKNLTLTILLLVFSITAYSQATNLNVTGICQATADPNTGTAFENVDEDMACTAARTPDGKFWVYDGNLTAGSQWVEVPLSQVIDTYENLTSLVVSGNILTATVTDENASTSTVTVDLSAFKQSVVAGSGITVSQSGEAFTVTNDAPDQTVTISSANANATVSGTYPDFTINVADQEADVTITAAANSGITVTESPANTFVIDQTALPEYSTMAAATTALGTGKKFRYAAGSLEGARGSVHTTY